MQATDTVDELLTLQEIDLEILRIESELVTLDEEVAELRITVDALREAGRRDPGRRPEGGSARGRFRRSVEAGRATLKRLESRSAAVVNEQQYLAVRSETETAWRNLRGAEDDQLDAMLELESAREAFSAAGGELKESAAALAERAAAADDLRSAFERELHLRGAGPENPGRSSRPAGAPTLQVGRRGREAFGARGTHGGRRVRTVLHLCAQAAPGRDPDASRSGRLRRLRNHPLPGVLRRLTRRTMRLRIIAGDLGGRYIDAPPGRRTRPTAARVREAWFSALGEDVVDARVADLYAGSGALGIEALSRGAAHVHFVESDRGVASVLDRNIRRLGLADRSRIGRRDALAWIDGLTAPLDLVLADPPYGSTAGRGLVERFRLRTIRRPVLARARRRRRSGHDRGLDEGIRRHPREPVPGSGMRPDLDT